jgi:integrase
MSGSGKTRGRVVLTARLIESFKPDTEPYCWSDVRAPGLRIRIAPSGLKTGDAVYRIKGSAKVKHVSLGRYGDVSLEEMRARVAELTSAARKGVDLIEQEAEARETASRAMSMKKFRELYLARRVRRRLRSAGEIERTLNRVLEPLEDLPAADIRRRHIAPLLEAIAAEGHERAAGNAKALIGGMFRWGEAQDIVEVDPTRGLPTYDKGRPRDRFLDSDEIRLVWPWLETLRTSTADALRVQLLLGARIGEVVGMTGAEIDRDKWLWTLPAARSKNAKPRITPLLGLAREIIERRLDVAGNDLLFLSERGAPLTSAGIGTELGSRRSTLPIDPFTSHDLRRTMASTMLELGISRDVIGAIISHEGGDRGSRTLIRHYLKSDLIARKTRALETWDARLRAIVSGTVADNVVAFAHGG